MVRLSWPGVMGRPSTKYPSPSSTTATRNLGISLARGKYVALIVGDAVPLDEWWLAAMVENLERDERVAGVYSRQIPHPEASALRRVLVNSLATASLERREQFASTPEQDREIHSSEHRRLHIFLRLTALVMRGRFRRLACLVVRGSLADFRQHRRTALEHRRLAAFDDVSSCLRRSVWEEIPFEKTNFGEDLR
jgi:rhamnosyltransferase